MKKKQNELNHKAFEEARRRVEKAFPYGGVKKGFYIKDLKETGVLGSMVKVAVSAVVNIVGDSLNLRTYRHPKEPGSDTRYKVDELRGINKNTVELLAGHEVPNHHISHDVPEDMMMHNNMTVEMIGDGQGGLRPNVQPDGMVKTYINFPDPTEEILRKARERAKNRASTSEDSPPAAR